MKYVAIINLTTQLQEVDFINAWLLGEECKPIIIRDAYKALHFVFPGTFNDLTIVFISRLGTTSIFTELASLSASETTSHLTNRRPTFANSLLLSKYLLEEVGERIVWPLRLPLIFQIQSMLRPARY
jgi:hypothetical protein